MARMIVATANAQILQLGGNIVADNLLTATDGLEQQVAAYAAG
jgi:hypothetical protein